jgi:hypothetical protein
LNEVFVKVVQIVEAVKIVSVISPQDVGRQGLLRANSSGIALALVLRSSPATEDEEGDPPLLQIPSLCSLWPL